MYYRSGLEVLSVAGNRLFGLGLSALCTGLINNTVLRKLDISDNKIDQVYNKSTYLRTIVTNCNIYICYYIYIHVIIIPSHLYRFIYPLRCIHILLYTNPIYPVYTLNLYDLIPYIHIVRG